MPILPRSFPTTILYAFVIYRMCARCHIHPILLHLITSIEFCISTKYDDPEEHCLLGCKTVSLVGCYRHFTGMYYLQNVGINLPNYMALHHRTVFFTAIVISTSNLTHEDLHYAVFPSSITVWSNFISEIVQYKKL